MDNDSLLEGLCNRDSTCQKQFWNTYWPRVYAICARILGGGADATDLTVDLLTEFIDCRVQHVEQAAAMGGYLRLMAVRRALDFRQKRARFSELKFEMRDTSSLSPEETAMVRNLMPRLEHCLPTLTPKAQQVLRLRFNEQLSNERIGTILGGSRQYIGRLIRQSLDVLRLCIEKGVTETLMLKQETQQ